MYCSTFSSSEGVVTVVVVEVMTVVMVVMVVVTMVASPSWAVVEPPAVSIPNPHLRSSTRMVVPTRKRRTRAARIAR